MRYNFPIVYGPKTASYDLPNGTDRKLVVSNRISLGILDMTEFQRCPSPPLPLPGNRGAIAHVVSPGDVALANFIAARGLRISIPRGDPRAFDTRVFERWVSLSGRTRPLSKTADVFKGCRF